MSTFVTMLLKFCLIFVVFVIMEKLSYERRTCESVDDGSMSEGISQKLMEKCLGL